MITFKHLIAVSLLAPFSALPASAQTACETLSNVLGTTSIVRSLQLNPSTLISSEDISTLNIQLNQISLEALAPAADSDELNFETLALSQYLSDLRQALIGMTDTDEAYAADTLSPAITPGFIRSLDSLNYYWNCSPANNVDLLSEITDKDSAQFFGPDSLTALNAESGITIPSVKASDAQQGRTTDLTVNRVAYNAVKITQENTVILMILGFAALLAGVFIYQKQLAKFEIREARSLIHSPIKVRMDDHEYNIHLVDISMNGAKIKHSRNIDTQDKLQIKLGGKWHLGYIKWSNEMFAGVMFKTPIGPKIISDVVKAT